ncbi:MAG: hypothetical protein AB8B63_04760 [Granulosicoccus sp.]
MITRNVEFNSKLIKRGTDLLLLAATVTAIGYWANTSAQFATQASVLSNAASTAQPSSIPVVSDEIPPEADDLERAPATITLPGNANHFDLLYADSQSRMVTQSQAPIVSRW